VSNDTYLADCVKSLTKAQQADRDAQEMAQLVTLTKALGVSRDYRKECWTAVVNGELSGSSDIGFAIKCADQALAAFDKRFPPL
jgi:hypothetical protein